MVRLNSDCLGIVSAFAFDCTAQELLLDLDFYVAWQQSVPPMFLRASALDTRFWLRVANPMVRFHPFTARKHLRLRPEDIWASTLPSLTHYISKELVRDLRTYRQCVIRWAMDAVQNRELWYYLRLRDKILVKLRQEHFRRNCPHFFVREALRQIHEHPF